MKENLPDGCDDIRFMRSLSEGDEKLRPWNEAVERFLETGDDWLWCTANDVTFLPGTLKRLLSWDKPLVSALVFMRASPVVPHIWQSYGDDKAYAMRLKDTFEWFMTNKDMIGFGPMIQEPKPAEALAPINFTSTSCTLIHRSVLEKMEKPYFEMDGYMGGGEDRRFMEKAKALGFQAYVDRSCIAGHLIGDIPSSSADFICWFQSSIYHNTGEPGTEVPPEGESDNGSQPVRSSN